MCLQKRIFTTELHESEHPTSSFIFFQTVKNEKFFKRALSGIICVNP